MPATRSIVRFNFLILVLTFIAPVAGLARQPVIGITGYVDEPGQRHDPGWGQFRMTRCYSECVIKAGGVPVHLVPVQDAAVAALLDRVDGLLLCGGPDMNPRRYGEDPWGTTSVLPQEREAFDFALAREAIGRQMPVLGICLGSQILNVVNGGTLIQDIPSAVSGHAKHRFTDLKEVGGVMHRVAIEAGSPLEAIYRQRTIGVNSAHHQAYKTLGAGLVVAARCPDDGIIEAFYSEGHPFLLGIQYHPERQYRPPGLHDPLFKAFVNAAQRYGKKDAVGADATPPTTSVENLFDKNRGTDSPQPGSAERDEGQEAAIAEIEKLGGRVEVYQISPDTPATGVYLDNYGVTDAALVHLKSLTNLVVLELERSQVTDASLEHLNGLTNLQELDFRSTQVTDEGIKRLQQALPKCKIHGQALPLTERLFQKLVGRETSGIAARCPGDFP